MRTSLNTHMPNYSQGDIFLLCIKGCKETRQRGCLPCFREAKKSLSTIFATPQNGKLFPLPKKKPETYSKAGVASPGKVARC